jgi:hypothetical protein
MSAKCRAASPATPFRPSRMAELRARLRIGRWNGSGGLYGTHAQVAEAKRLVRAQLKGKAPLQFLDDRKLNLARRFSRVYRRFTGWDLTAALNLLKPVYGLMRGIPTNRSLASAYWRKRMPPPAMIESRSRRLWSALVRARCAARWRARRASRPDQCRHAPVARLRADGFDDADHRAR